MARAGSSLGINDFDDAAELPFTGDLVRLAASVRASAVLATARKTEIVRALRHGVAPVSRARRRIQAEALAGPPEPFVLEDRHPALAEPGDRDGRGCRTRMGEDPAELGDRGQGKR